jgi:hypothetical protein
MAKRKRRATRRAPAKRTQRRGRRTVHRGSGPIAAVKHDMPMMVAGAIYGVIEGKAKEDDAFFLNKLPRPLDALGYTGNVAVMLYLAQAATGNRHVKTLTSAVATIAAYKLGRNKGAFTTADKTSIGHDHGSDEHVIEDHVMGALEAEGMDHTVQPGLKYDDVVREAGART